MKTLLKFIPSLNNGLWYQGKNLAEISGTQYIVFQYFSGVDDTYLSSCGLSLLLKMACTCVVGKSAIVAIIVLDDTSWN